MVVQCVMNVIHLVQRKLHLHCETYEINLVSKAKKRSFKFEILMNIGTLCKETNAIFQRENRFLHPTLRLNSLLALREQGKVNLQIKYTRVKQ